MAPTRSQAAMNDLEYFIVTVLQLNADTTMLSLTENDIKSFETFQTLNPDIFDKLTYSKDE